ncbi:hypothetical protein H3H54_14490 [Brachybacterium sp. Z12]|uniref:hypothetical protein n=1 Tax=Brachybacterium sp. Z12 TaxID=2759167 RepID=UPI001862BE07|nr:hypothetical protein [Brachybacterium sp. Z12]QNN82265.1 hypothetical protein H3H54_14490 [Brachybacterium sp. Z12]
MTDDELDGLRRAVLDEQERRVKVAQLPGELAAMARDAVAAGCDPETLRERVDDALTPEQAAALDA